MKFLHLKIHSSYSLSQGEVRIEDLVEFAVENKIPALAIADEGNLFGALEFALEAKKQGIQPIIGVCLMVSSLFDGKAIEGKIQLIAKNEQGYKNLLKLVSKSFLNSSTPHKPSIDLKDLSENRAGLILLSGGESVGLIPILLKQNLHTTAVELTKYLTSIFGNDFYLEIQRFNLNNDEKTQGQIKEIAIEQNIALVATNEVYYLYSDLFPSHDALLCIANGAYLAQDERAKSNPEYYFKSEDEMASLFADVPEALENTINIAKKCSFFPKESNPALPKFSDNEEAEIKQIALKGLEKRLSQENILEAEIYHQRLEYELAVITKMNFSGYFLIVSDFVKFAKNNDIPVGPGRGSGAGSLVAWVLEITELNPIKYGLIFERFLNPDRISMPDFDIDFCQDRREEIITYVANKYGYDKVAHIITFGKLQARAVLRDVGRVLQIPLSQVDKICKMVPFNPIDPITLEKAVEMDPKLQEAMVSDNEIKRLIEIALKLEGLNRHASTHAAGIVIGCKPLEEIVPLYRDEGANLPITQFSMKYAELAGLVKFDFLGLKTLTMIKNTCDVIFKTRAEKININTIPLNDKKTFAMLAEGKGTGVFQMESSGMKEVLRKMKPDSIEDIIALISLYRPGPMENIPSYILRKHGKEKPDYILPQLEAVLKETYGVIIYQEQVMEIAKIVAGYSLAEADILRRAMGKKNKDEMDKQRSKFIEGCKINNIDKEKATYIFDLLAKFAGYGFNKSHAACYALIGYQTAYLKANYPTEFFSALMNMDIGDTDKLCMYVAEVKKLNIEILSPDINFSEAHFAVEDNKIRYGLKAIKSVGEKAIEEIIKIRTENSSFKSLDEMLKKINHANLNKRMLEALCKAGAFDSIIEKEKTLNRRRIFENSTHIVKYLQEKESEGNKKQASLFGENSSDSNVIFLNDYREWEEELKLAYEAEAVGFYLNSHPISKFQNEFKNLNIKLIADVEELENTENSLLKISGVVQKAVHRFSGDKRFSYLYISDPSGFTEISLFNNQLINNSSEMIESKQPLYFLTEFKKDEGGSRIIAKEIKYLEEFLNNQKRTIALKIENFDDFAKIKSLLIAKKESKFAQKTELLFQFKINDVAFEFVEQNLDKKYDFSISNINSLKSVLGEALGENTFS
ncbi:MAG: DNA polymerase III subunit alpha [Alphaproteobacteria bacterium]